MSVLFAACTPLPYYSGVQARAPFDMDCPKESLTYTELSGTCSTIGLNGPCTMGVSGCGRRATYIEVERGTWVMNNAASDTPPQATPDPGAAEAAKE